MKLLILTAEQSTLQWASLPKKLAEIKLTLNSGKNADWLVDIKFKSAFPIIKDKRIDSTWLNDHIRPFFQEGYDIVAFHFSKRQRNAWGIEPSLRGSNPRTDDGMGDLYFWADETTMRLDYEQFTETLLHEVCHEYYSVTGEPDITHAYHEKNKTIVGLFKQLDWAKYQNKNSGKVEVLKRARGILEALVALLKRQKPTTLLHPVEKYKNLISNPYGTRDEKWYPQTKHHIGTDYATPVGTPVRAPWDGEVTVSGFSPALGNFCHYKYVYDGVTYVARFLHLSDKPYQAKYKRGEVIELSGKSGRISGPHLHVDLFYNEVRIDILTESNFKNLTINPETHYV